MGSSRRVGSRQRQELRTRFLRALERPIILHSAMQSPVYGWALRKTLQAWGSYIGAGRLYPLLNALEREGLLQGHISEIAGRKRKYYQITE
jgi:DNA-binding PadR family transcriptional regulator